MDAPRTDVESCALLRDVRGCKVTLLVALQNVILTGCLFAGLYLYWTGHGQDPVPPELQEFPEDVHIIFSPISGIIGNTTLEFSDILRQYKMNLSDDSRISTECTGPYILHMYVCYKNTTLKANASLQLQVAGKTTDPLCTFELNSSSGVCRGLQCNAYLTVREQAVLRLYSTGDFIDNVTVGFNYLLGSRCLY